MCEARQIQTACEGGAKTELQNRHAKDASVRMVDDGNTEIQLRWWSYSMNEIASN